MRVHTWCVSPYAAKVHMVLRYKGVAYDNVPATFAARRESRRRTGSGKVPFLVDGDAWVSDSTAIAAYLERRQPDPTIYPAARPDRERCLLLEDWADEALVRTAVPLLWMNDRNMRRLLGELAAEMDSRVMRLVVRWFGPTVRRKFGHWMDQHGGERATIRLFDQQTEALDDALERGPFLFGETPTIADFAVAGQLWHLHRLGGAGKLEERRHLVRLLEACTATLR